MALPITMSLRELLLGIGRFLGDAHFVKSTIAGTISIYQSSALAWGGDNRYAGSELFLWDKPAAMTADNPMTVGSSLGAGVGQLILTEANGVNAFGIGLRAVVQNIGGKGYPHDRRAWALQMALAEQPGLVDAQVTIATPDQTTYWNAIPAGVRSVIRVIQIDPSGMTAELAPGAWQDNLDLPGRRLRLPYDLTSGYTYAVVGRADLSNYFAADPPDWTATVQVDPTRVIKDAVKWLLMGSKATREQDIASNLYNDHLRTSRETPRSNEVFLP